MTLAEPLTVEAMQPMGPTVTDISDYLDHIHRRRLSPTTIRVRRDVLGGIERDLPCALLDASTEDLCGALDRRELAPASMRAYLSHLHAFYAWAQRSGRRDDDPTVDIERPKLDSLLPREPIGTAELAMALEVTEGQVRCWLTLMAYAGLRCCEVATLDASDIDIEGRSLRVTGKGRKERWLRMHDRIADELRRQQLADTGPVFRRPDGEPYHQDRIGRLIAAKLRSIGINSTAHTLRHRFATNLHDLCLDMRVVQVALGHASIATTQIYVQPNRERLAAAMAAL